MSAERLSLLLSIDEKTGNTRYVGNLEIGKRAARAERYPEVSRRSSGNYLVELHDHPDEDSAAEWGMDATEDGAWRFALGAFFGPLDAEYDESALVAYLTTFITRDDLDGGAR